MSLKKFLLSGVFLRQLIFAAALFVIIIILTLRGLKIYTRHGQANPVPNFTGLNQTEANEIANQHNLLVEIIDSAHVNGALPGVVVEQVPENGFKVKENRTVFLTINATLPEQVALPKLTDISFRQAQVLIENCGLVIGQISYQPSEYNGLVLNIQQDSTDILPGEQLAKGDSVDLIIGSDQEIALTPLPNVIGLTIQEARTTITDAMLNPGVLIFDDSVILMEDSLNAKIWQQRPSRINSATVNLGSTVDLWVTVDLLKIDNAIKQNH
ncbi:MAG: PASTA domain-containing protein [Prolixibacteraceae bacterium]|jgi:eukaryotic-like serine/threonine-protein kinase|nr:PASTA domain-containing protein [Prolixibacteraceae bacterium]MBT6764685.1 PASTA domain-containing protein [Prolixibacteraceae bacterium]MBT7000825.1 PASTA domain-containing protein [Prolixibacteraceae bacterium]MBT7395823.1 PASTA domain-containing protein [Prolixibacteraceae bacterium]